MPYLMIQTNQALAPEKTGELLRKASQVASEVLGKPESYVMAAFKGGVPMVFAGSGEPCAYLELKSIGLPEARTGELSNALCDLVQTELGVGRDRVYIEFAGAQRHMFGWNGGTF